MKKSGKLRLLAFVVFALAAIVAGCGGDDDDDSAAPTETPAEASAPAEEPAPASAVCEGSIAFMGPITGPVAVLGGEQLAWAQFAIDVHNEEFGSNFVLVAGDTMLDPAEGAVVAEQLSADTAIIGVVGPAGSQVVEASAAILDGKIAFISGSATNTALTQDTTTFFRTVGVDDVQGPTTAQFMIDDLGAVKVVIIDDQESYSTGLADSTAAVLDEAGIEVVRKSVSQDATDFTALVSDVGDDVDVVYLPWQVATSGELFAAQMTEQGKTAVVFGSVGLFTDEFTADGAYVAAFMPDITEIEDPSTQEFAERYVAEARGEFGTFGPPSFTAADVLVRAAQAVCARGEMPTRENVIEGVRATNIAESILGQPLTFDATGDVVGGKFFIFQNMDGEKQLIQ